MVEEKASSPVRDLIRDHLEIRSLKRNDIQRIAEAFTGIGWKKPASLYRRYLHEQEIGQRAVLIATRSDIFCGYLTIVWASSYPFFQQEGIPEIVDFNVLPQFQRQGIGSLLMDEAEGRIAQRSPKAGIGVGLTADYGPAHILYIKRGYIPDGRGLTKDGRPLGYGEQISVDDRLTLYFTKRLPPGREDTV
jgi:ribosomal protein S18 acetylase RimI-like enzyme